MNTLERNNYNPFEKSSLKDQPKTGSGSEPKIIPPEDRADANGNGSNYKPELLEKEINNLQPPKPIK